MQEKNFATHKFNKIAKLHYFLSILLGFTLFSCSITKNLPEDKYLLKENKIEIDSKEISKKKIQRYIKQKPNRRTLGIRLPLYIYNMADPDKEEGFSKWLKKNGEKPVIWDKYLTKESKTQIEYFLENEGYYSSKVKDTVIFDDQKATVKYKIQLNDPYIIDSINFVVKDSVLLPYIYNDSSNTLIHSGDIFSVNLLQKERERIEEYLKTKGFYKFSKDFVSYIADTSESKNLVDLKIVINKNVIREGGTQTKRVSHKRYKVRDIYVFPNYDPETVLADNEEYRKKQDTAYYEQIRFVYKNEPGIKTEVIRQANYILPGQLYNQEDVNSTYNHLNSLRIFKFININFQEVGSVNDEPQLDCYIYLKKYKLQSYTIELEGTNSSGNIGGAGNLLYRHKSLFGGAEQFQTKLTGAFEILDQEQFSRLDHSKKLGVEMGLDVPKFMAPFLESEKFVKKYTPKTSISGLYNYQERPDYTRTLSNLSYGYKWQGNRFLTHFINPLELNILQLPYLSDIFKESINNTYLENSYKDHFLSVTSYSLIFNNQDVKKINDFHFLRFNTEFGGNLLTAFNELTNAETVNGNYQLFGIRYAQYFKVDFDIRYYQILNPNNRFVYRLFVGGGVPYGNSEALPFVKQYFAGGANSIRAWNVRSLGPGSFTLGDIKGYPNQTADLKIEMNWEYRFKILGILEGAIFTDIGNIWALNRNDMREGALFQYDKFLEDMAIGTGLGIRFDLSFSVIRLDLGLQFRDPSKEEYNRWLIGNRPINHNTLTWNIAIGYPF